MSRYIDADNIKYTDLSDGLGLCYVAFKDRIDRMPTDDVEKVKHGEWIPIIENYHSCETDTVSTRIIGYQCSLCGAEEKFKYKYCHCGAKMDKE